MANPRQSAVAAESPADAPRDPQTQVLLTHADFEALVNELESLRMRYRGELAGRLREARAFGGTGDNDDLLAALEEAAIDQARIAHLEELVRSASVVEQPIADGGAGLGSTVHVVDDAGRTTEYRLIGRRSPDSGRYDVTMASPVGQALWGSRPGAVVRVPLPNGRHRTLRVIDVSHSLPAPSADEARSAATRAA